MKKYITLLFITLIIPINLYSAAAKSPIVESDSINSLNTPSYQNERIADLEQILKSSTLSDPSIKRVELLDELIALYEVIGNSEGVLWALKEKSKIKGLLPEIKAEVILQIADYYIQRFRATKSHADAIGSLYYYNEALSYPQTKIKAQLALGSIYMGELLPEIPQDLSKAQNFFKQVLVSKDLATRSLGHIGLADVFVQLGEYDKARALYALVKEAAPSWQLAQDKILQTYLKESIELGVDKRGLTEERYLVTLQAALKLQNENALKFMLTLARPKGMSDQLFNRSQILLLIELAVVSAYQNNDFKKSLDYLKQALKKLKKALDNGWKEGLGKTVALGKSKIERVKILRIIFLIRNNMSAVIDFSDELMKKISELSAAELNSSEIITDVKKEINRGKLIIEDTVYDRLNALKEEAGLLQDRLSGL